MRLTQSGQGPTSQADLTDQAASMEADMYVPPVATPEYKPGDVVECQHQFDSGPAAALVYRAHSRLHVIWKGSQYSLLDSRVKVFKKLGTYQGSVDSYEDAVSAAKAYFSKAEIKPTFTGSYAERQEQAVKHYGWKRGSIVKVSQKFEQGETGYHGGSWEHKPSKAAMQGQVVEIKDIAFDGIWLNTADKSDFWKFPYTALEPVK